MTERERLIAFMQERQLDNRTLGRAMRWSPAFIYGFLGGAWSMAPGFRRAFVQTFGDDVAEQIFDNNSVTISAPEAQPA